jgi:hypothetical protein
MIKQVGTIGFFIKFNESASSSLKFLEIFSSSALTTSLFSASTNSSSNIIIPSTASSFINGEYSSTLYSDEWAHVSFIFDPKLNTAASNNFIVRFGDSTKANFQIQNIYIVDSLLDQLSIRYIHNEFVGNTSYLSAGDSASSSINVFDREESLHTSSVTSIVYQPFKSQQKFLTSVLVATDLSASAYILTELTRAAQFFDGVKVISGNRILSLLDNQVYEVLSNSKLSVVTSSVGDYVEVLDGVKYEGFNFVKTQSGFQTAPFLQKVSYIESIQQ